MKSSHWGDMVELIKDLDQLTVMVLHTMTLVNYHVLPMNLDGWVMLSNQIPLGDAHDIADCYTCNLFMLNDSNSIVKEDEQRNFPNILWT